MPNAGATYSIASFALQEWEPPPENCRALSRALIDTVGCALAGHSSPTMQIMFKWAALENSGGSSTVWSTGERTGATRAALLNATAAHALDWDDVAPNLLLHPSAVLLPALLAVAEEIDASGAELAVAHEVGAAVFRAVTEMLPGRQHYDKGWHSTSTVGRIAATAALCRLRSLPPEQGRHALGIAASLASGSLANFGTMTKPLHAGAAARDAVLAVGLAAAGFTANQEQLESPDGFFAIFGDPELQDLSGFDSALSRWRQDWTQEWALKQFPSCYATHRAIEAALSLRGSLAGHSVAQVSITVGPGQLRPLLKNFPRDAQEAKFSMEYVVATALVDGDVTLSHFGRDAFDREDVRKLMQVVTAHESADVPGGERQPDGYAVVDLVTDEGANRTARVDVTRGDASRPLTDEEILAKFIDCCEQGGMHSRSARTLAEFLYEVPASTGLAQLHDHLKSAVARHA